MQGLAHDQDNSLTKFKATKFHYDHVYTRDGLSPAKDNLPETKSVQSNELTRRIKLEGLLVEITTHSFSHDDDFPTDRGSETDDPSLQRKRPILYCISVRIPPPPLPWRKTANARQMKECLKTPEKTADISASHHWFPKEMKFEERA